MDNEAEEWAKLCRCAETLDFGYRLEPPLWRRDLGVPIPEVEQEFRSYTNYRGIEHRVSVPNKTYVIRCGDFLKIGITADIHARLRTIESHNPHPLEVVALLVGGRAVERSLHLRFKAYRHRDEWFRVEGELAAWVEEGCPHG